MTVDDAWVRLQRQLENTFGVEEASILMDRPPGGWSDLVTNQTLDRKIDVLRHELRTEMTGLRSEMTGLRSEMFEFRADLRVEMTELSASVDRRLRAQTWMMMTTMIAAVGVSATLSHL
jgi:hypothetical protein